MVFTTACMRHDFIGITTYRVFHKHRMNIGENVGTWFVI